MSAPFDLPKAVSLRHPNVSLRTTLVMKLTMLLEPGSQVTREQITEFLDDLTEYIRGDSGD